MSKENTGLKEVPTHQTTGGETKELLVKGKELGDDKGEKERAAYVEKLNKEQESKKKEGLTKGDSETAKINKKIEEIDKKSKVDENSQKAGLGNQNRINAELASGILRHAGNLSDKEADLVKRESHVRGHENAKGEEDAERKFLDTRI